MVLVFVIRAALNTRKTRTKSVTNRMKTGVRASVIILPLLGLPWVINLMEFSKQVKTIYYQYVLGIFISLQGILILLLHCILDKKVRIRDLELEHVVFDCYIGDSLTIIPRR